MAKGNQILLQLKAENAQLKSKLKESGKKVNTMASKMKKSATMMKTSFLKVGLAITGLILIFKKIWKTTSIQIEAENNLATALANTSNATGVTLESLKKYAAEIQNVTTVGDEESLSAMQMGLSMGIAADQIGEATKQAIGLAKAYKVDLKASMKLVALARAGEYSMLARYVPQLRGVTDKTKQAAIANEAMAKGFKIAEAEAKTMPGRMKQLKNSFGDVVESIGKSLVPALENLGIAFSGADGKGGGFLHTLGRVFSTIVSSIAIIIHATKPWALSIKQNVLGIAASFSTAIASIMSTIAKGMSAFGRIVEAKRMNAAADSLRNFASTAKVDMEKIGVAIKGHESKYKKMWENTKQIWADETNTDNTKTKNYIANLNKKIKKDKEAKELKKADYLTYIGESTQAELLKEEERYALLLASKANFELNMAAIETAYEQKKVIAQAKGLEARRKADLAYFNAKVSLHFAEFGVVQSIASMGTTLMQSSNKKLFKLGKGLAFAQASMNTFQAVTKVFAQWGWPFGAIFGAVAAAALGVQLHSIKRQKIPSYEKGRVPVLEGGRMPQDHFPAFIGQKEFVINEQSSRSNYDLLKWIQQNPGKEAGSGGGGGAVYNFNGPVLGWDDFQDKMDNMRNEKAGLMGAENYSRGGVYK